MNCSSLQDNHYYSQITVLYSRKKKHSPAPVLCSVSNLDIETLWNGDFSPMQIVIWMFPSYQDITSEIFYVVLIL